MPITTAPRSVSDATRFTPTTPHASSKAAEPRFASPSGSVVNASRGGARATPPSGGSGGSGGGGGGRSPRFTETPDEKVARLRAAHLRARNAKVSKFDKIVDHGRRFFDSAHKITVVGLIGFTAISALLTVYTAADMIMYNNKRKAEFIEAQMKLEADSLEAARLAYMTGKATDDQISLVEEMMEREQKAGKVSGSHIFDKLPSALGAPKSKDSSSASDNTTQSQKVTEAATWPQSLPASGEPEQAGKKSSSGGIWSWMTSNLKKEEEGTSVGTSGRRLGWESLSEEDDCTGVRDSDLVRAVEDKALAAIRKEKENQRKGGPLDRVGLEADKKPEEPKEKGWGWW
ncbi:cytochrome oxidase c assembly-domain-containing protein [Podospora didyma]|uniref:Cytochrome oxidase c assembly-domain-containing protein n=1 Tax=Podospora didyma TaxID=330526 RepID=A0AAE0NI40_9PEZI|nr:cytochrome oxidase c assembly-domain-containing protein [Podospora didyma]